MSVAFKKINSVNVVADNSTTTSRTYDISGNVNIRENVVNSIDPATVMKNGAEVAYFSKHGESLNISFNGVAKSEQQTIVGVVNDFCSEVADKAQNEPIEL